MGSGQVSFEAVCSSLLTHFCIRPPVQPESDIPDPVVSCQVYSVVHHLGPTRGRHRLRMQHLSRTACHTLVVLARRKPKCLLLPYTLRRRLPAVIRFPAKCRGCPPFCHLDRRNELSCSWCKHTDSSHLTLQRNR